MSRSGRMDSKCDTQSEKKQELLDIEEAADCYGCQSDRIRDFIARGVLHPLFDRQEIEELRQKHLHKQINARSSPRQKR
jgi:hypothetical protein